MKSIFPEAITKLPKADIPLEGLEAFLSQGPGHQILFMQFEKDASLPLHSHEAQYGIVLEGTITLTIGGQEHTYTKGDRYYIPEGIMHSARVSAGYADVTFFDQKDRYSTL